MRIAALALEAHSGRSALRFDTVDAGLSVFVGPPHSGPATLADFLAHMLYGKQPAADQQGSDQPRGEIIVATATGRFRLRHGRDDAQPGRVITSLDGDSPSRDAMRHILGSLSPAVLSRVCVIDFDAGPRLEWLASGEHTAELLAWQRWQEELAAQDDRRLRASDYLAQLTNGDYLRLAPTRAAGKLVARTRDGGWTAVESLDAGDQNLVYLSLSLAIVGGNPANASMPLLLGEPSVHLDPRRIAALAVVLRNYSRRGYQLLVFTGDAALVQRFRSLGVTIHPAGGRSVDANMDRRQKERDVA